MLQEKICSGFELKQFCFSTLNKNVKAFDLARFIESKSAFKYTVLEIDFILDTFKILEEYKKLTFEFENKWKSIYIPKQ